MILPTNLQSAGDLPSLESEIRQLAAADEIRQLASRYARGFDSRDLDSLMDLFVAADVPLAYPDFNAANVARDMPGFWSYAGPTILFVGNHIIDFTDAETAEGSVYCQAKLSLDGAWIEQAIQYADSYVRTGSGWRFAQRRHLLFYGVSLPERPLDQPETTWPRSAVGRGSLPEEWPSWRAFHGIAEAPSGFYSTTP